MSSGTNSERITQNTSKINSSIEKIKNLKVATFQDKEITENGTYTADEDYSGLRKVTVNVASSGTDTSDATATADDILVDKTAYVNGEKLTGNIQNGKNAIYPFSIKVTGGIVSTVDNKDVIEIDLKPNVSSTWAVNNTTQLSTPISEEFIAGTIDLTADKIVKGETVLGIEGTAETGTDTSDATATAEDIVEGKTAYVNGEKLEGTVVETAYGNTLNLGLTIFNNISSEGMLEFIFGNFGNNLLRPFSNVTGTVDYATVAEKIGLTADVIKKGVTVLGIEGTYEGGEDDTNVFTEEEAEVANTNLNDVLGIEDDEISNLPKEDEEEANNILNDILDINEDE
jgi:hypothetical protein